MSANEKLMGRIVRHRAMMIQVENGVMEELVQQLGQVRKEALDKLVAASNEPLTKKGVESLVEEIRIDLTLAREDMTATLKDRLAEAFTAEEELAMTVFRGAVPMVVAKATNYQALALKRIDDILKMPVAGVSYEQAIANMFDRLGGQIDKLAQKAFAEGFQEALYSGKTMAQARGAGWAAAEKLQSNLGAARELFDKAVRKDLETIVHGHYQATIDKAQTSVYQQNRKLLQGVVFTATLDHKTCPICGALDGTVYWMDGIPEGEEGDVFERKPALPIHPHCRCTYAPIVKAFKSLPIDDSKFSKASQKLLDGDIPKPDRYDAWFAKQSGTVQRDILGAGRYDLWKSGSVDLADLSKNGQVLTLDQLRGK